MIQIDRMIIDDAGGNPEKLAFSVIKQIVDLSPPVPVREIAEAVDIYEIREDALIGFEGGLITTQDKSEGAILVRGDRPEARKRFTISHELGHYLNPWHTAKRADGFRCRAKDMAVVRFQVGDRAMQMEVEANQFAAELLMPTSFITSFIHRLAGIDIEHILLVAEKFEVSREAAARRYVEAHDEFAAVIFSKDGVIRYAKKHKSFPPLCVRKDDLLPELCISKRSSLPVGRVSDWCDVDGDIWLRDAKGRHIVEQTLAQHNGFRMTLISVSEDESNDDEQETDWNPPSFHRPRRRP